MPNEEPGRQASPPHGGRASQADVSALEELARHAARWSSSSFGFATALGIVLVWLATGPFLHYSNTWQLVINTGTTIVTFLMVFLIQRSQGKDALAIQIKLDELVAALAGASNRLVAAEDLSEADLEDLHRRYRVLSERARHLADKQVSLSLDTPRTGRRRNGKKRPASERTNGARSERRGS
ncbi:MAG TPA: low affinity iron permease family protein [Vicinamibacteria bacterium]|nr:low affinity iron permease family protein [Vicinamibacteria bacterium]